ncbi:MAG: phosphoribosyltransferase family protein [Patescibacteria group bacterium]
MFKDRKEAGKILAKKLKEFCNKDDVIVFGITRGGVVVADEISKKLKLPLEIIVIKKIGAPLNPELAIGAVGPGETVYWDERLLDDIYISEDYKKESVRVKTKEREVLENYLKSKKDRAVIKEKKIILVDDGIATGATVLTAVKYFRNKKAGKVILAAPIIAKDTYRNIDKYFDTIVALEVSNKLNSVGQFYANFDQVENTEVKDIIERQ